MAVLLVASTGGHLAQLHRLAPRLTRPGEDVVWVTFDTTQTSELLEGEEVVHVPYTAPRDLRNTLVASKVSHRLLRSERFDTVVSTGAAVAVAFLPLAAARGIGSHYIESAARTSERSLTGRILSAVPGVRCYTQYAALAGRRWSFRGSVFDEYEAEQVRQEPEIRKVVVTLGTIPFRFDRLLARVQSILPQGAEVFWQTGESSRGDLRGTAHRLVAPSEMVATIRSADAVIAHAGVGSALDALDAGKVPILVPREKRYAEHVDEHQWEVAIDLSKRGLAVVRNADELSFDDLLRAGRYGVNRTSVDKRFALDP